MGRVVSVIVSILLAWLVWRLLLGIIGFGGSLLMAIVSIVLFIWLFEVILGAMGRNRI